MCSFRDTLDRDFNRNMNKYIKECDQPCTLRRTTEAGKKVCLVDTDKEKCEIYKTLTKIKEEFTTEQKAVIDQLESQV